MWTRWSRVKVTTRGAAGSDGEIDCSSPRSRVRGRIGAGTDSVEDAGPND
jgi:hypothetical protein